MSCVLIRHLAFKFTYLKKKKKKNHESATFHQLLCMSNTSLTICKYGKPKKSKIFQNEKGKQAPRNIHTNRQGKKKFNRKDCRQFFYLMMGPLDTSLGTKPRIRNPTCQNCPSGNPRLRELKLGYLGLGLQIWKGKIERQRMYWSYLVLPS